MTGAASSAAAFQNGSSERSASGRPSAFGSIIAPRRPSDVTATRSSSAASSGDWSGTVASPACRPPTSASDAASPSFWARLHAAPCRGGSE